MTYKFLILNFDVKNNEYFFKEAIEQETGEILTLENLINVQEPTTYYCDKLHIFFLYAVKFLHQNNFINSKDVKTIEDKQFFFSYRSGKCSNITIKNKVNILFVDFKSKFGLEFGDYITNAELLEYAIKHGRIGKTLGHDAFNEFLHTKFKVPIVVPLSNDIMREDYPIMHDTLLNRAKLSCSGFQFVKSGTYENVFEYDQSSAYPAQLLGCTPQGQGNLFEKLEDVPPNYFKIISFCAMDCKLKKNKIDFVSLPKAINDVVLPERLFELFKENYSGIIKIRQILAFKTRKNVFNKFINKNIIAGKLGENRPHIAKYNKYIANSLTGYFGRNEETSISYVKFNGKKMTLKSEKIKIDPIYLPVYIYTLDKSKTEFIRQLQNNYNNIIYANTDGFISTKELDVEKLNFENSCSVGLYRCKHVFKELYIECINGYAGITTDGTVENTISGLTLTRKITPQEYQQRKILYSYNTITDNGTFVRKIIDIDGNEQTC